jgi:signal transduction histidine kinase
MKNTSRAYLFLLLGCIIGIGVLHSFTPGDKVFLHETYRRLSYFPIVLGALLYGVRGGILFAGCTTLAFIPHLHLFHKMDYNFYLGELTEIGLYFAAGWVVGAIASRESMLKEKYQELSEKLERSYDRLHKETELLIEVEEQLRASQKLSALGQLSASLAHEIKNPLGSIRGAAEIFLDEFPEGHPKREFVEILLKETTRLNTTVEEVLRFSRDQQNAVEQRPSMDPLAAVIKRVITLLDNKFRKKSIDLKLEIPLEADTFLVDGDKMAQVFINLLLNSFKAVEQTGRVELTVFPGELEYTIICSDNGSGIPEKDFGKVFAPFYSGKEDGTGLGLAISSKIVESYGGRIEVGKSRIGGAEFTIFLPTRS